jgi:RNA polymerase sigma-70 factor (ECF subfamily)
VHKAQDYYPKCPEGFLVSLARTGDRAAFEELVRRRQSSIRGLMRYLCSDVTLADDLAQQVFFKMWLSIRTLRNSRAFGAWLKRLAVSIWLQHIRKKDALRGATELIEKGGTNNDSDGVGMDLDNVLATLADPVRLCIVLSYNEGMSHREITDITELPLGTVKSHINRGSKQLQNLLSAYKESPDTEITS